MGVDAFDFMPVWCKQTKKHYSCWSDIKCLLDIVSMYQQIKVTILCSNLWVFTVKWNIYIVGVNPTHLFTIN
jgi:hypothetical protein